MFLVIVYNGVCGQTIVRCSLLKLSLERKCTPLIFPLSVNGVGPIRPDPFLVKFIGKVISFRDWS